MKRKKLQKIEPGSVVKIAISDEKIVFGRLLPGRIGIYDLVVKIEDNEPTIEFIIAHKIILYTHIFDYVIKRREIEIIGFKELTLEEINRIPPSFSQSENNYEDCTMYWHDGRSIKVKPEECVGLEPSVIYNSNGLVERINDFFAGRKNFDVEYHKVILNASDPRYLAGPNLKWDFEKEEFYRFDVAKNKRIE